MNISDLNKIFGIDKQLRFSHNGCSEVIISIETSKASASISFLGGQVLHWQPKHQRQPVLWLSDRAQYRAGKAIRGGVPICWPWFGVHPRIKELPGHGFARLKHWNLISANVDVLGVATLRMNLPSSEIAENFYTIDWPLAIDLLLELRIAETLEITLTTINNSDQTISITEGLHTYFQVSDVQKIRVHGLNDCHYLDLVDRNNRYLQCGDIIFNNNELGRLYLNHTEPCCIVDAGFSRSIRIEKSGSLSTAVWNPGQDRAAAMDDMKPDGWRQMVCVESANALGNYVELKPKASHIHRVIYSVEPLALR